MRAGAFWAATALLLGACSGRAIDVQVEARADRSVALVYSGLYGQERIDLGPAEPARARDWTVETAGVVLKTEGGRDALLPAAGKSALPPAVSVRIAAQPLAGAGATVTRLGAEGALVETRLLMPYTNEKAAGRISFVAAPGRIAAAFGQAQPALADWRGRKDALGLVYVGPAAGKAGAAGLVFEAATPAWIVKEVESLSARLAPALDAAMGKRLEGPLDIFVGVAPMSEPAAETAPAAGTDAAEAALAAARAEANGLSYGAAQAPGQIVIELSGPGWRDASPDAAELLWRALSSESAKQWLAAGKARPPAWLAEGAADALADEALVAAKIWTADDSARALARAHAACAALVEARPLSDIAAGTAVAAARPCGHAFARAGAGEKGAAAFWRAFDKSAKKSGKAGVNEFLLVAATQAGPHDAALMRTLMKTTGIEAKDALEALRQDGL